MWNDEDNNPYGSFDRRDLAEQGSQSSPSSSMLPYDMSEGVYISIVKLIYRSRIPSAVNTAFDGFISSATNCVPSV
jgi:hypothetical protein